MRPDAPKRCVAASSARGRSMRAPWSLPNYVLIVSAAGKSLPAVRRNGSDSAAARASAVIEVREWARHSSTAA